MDDNSLFLDNSLLLILILVVYYLLKRIIAIDPHCLMQLQSAKIELQELRIFI